MRPSSSPKRTANRAIEAFTPKALILNHELRQCFIIGDIGIGKSGRIQPYEKPSICLAGIGLRKSAMRTNWALLCFSQNLSLPASNTPLKPHERLALFP